MNTELLPIYHFVADGSGTEKCFHDLIRFGLTYKFPNIAVPLDDKALTDVLFGFSATDKITVWGGRAISGQDFEELFITSIFLKAVEERQTGKLLILALPPNGRQESYDTVIAGCDPKEVKVIDGKLRLSETKSGFTLHIQVKRDYEHVSDADKIVIPKPADLTRLEKWSEEYSEFVLVFMQTFSLFSSEDAESILKDGNTGIIHVFNEEVALRDHETDEPNGVIKPRGNNAFNFLVSIGDKIHHVYFSFPPFLVRKTASEIIGLDLDL